MNDAPRPIVCKCGRPEQCARDFRFPVVFDERTNEYHLRSERWFAIMRYCFWCGGQLPESTRGDLFTTPTADDQADVQNLLSGAKTANDILEILGLPDQVLQGNEGGVESYERVVQWKRTLRYSNRWTSLILDVYEQPNGTFAYSIFARLIDTASEQPPERQTPWWQFWRR